jgi:ligand-binding sensor domain-containing protein
MDRGDTWKVISPNLTYSANKEKKSFASGAFVESQIKKGLLYVGTDRGAFWVSKNDGASWEEQDKNLPNHYIRSICSSRFKESRVYMAMTGINTDDLHKYLFVSENYGITWKNISNGLPDEPVNVIMEDPKNENILYAGSIRGVYISIDKGQNWSCLGSELPQTAVADLKINEVTMDLVVATHGRGIFKLNLKPIHSLTNDSLDNKKDHLFKVETIQRPWFNSNGGEANYRSFEKADFSFWLKEAKTIKLALFNKMNNEIWQININGNKGFNQFRWDITTEKRKSDAPYFVHYDKFIEAGNYTLRAYFGETVADQSVKVTEGVSPYIEKY